MIKLLIVEDEFLMRERLVKAIDWASISCEVSGQAENGVQALELLHDCLADIVITDIKMPQMDGIALTEAISQQFPQIKVIIMTGYNDFVFAQSAIRLGVKDYILKPSHKEEILGAVTRVAEQLRQEKGQTPEVEPVKLKKAIVDTLEYINQHYMEDISLTKVAEHIHVHPVYLGRTIRKHLGENYSDIVLRVRIENAKKILTDPDTKTYEVADQVGIQDPHYFSQVFKKYTGMTPSEYRETLRKRPG